MEKISSLSSPTCPHPSLTSSESLSLFIVFLSLGEQALTSGVLVHLLSLGQAWLPGSGSSVPLCLPLEKISYVLGPGWFLFCCLPLTQWLWIWALGRGNRVCPLGLLPPGWEGPGRAALAQPIPVEVSPLSHPSHLFQQPGLWRRTTNRGVGRDSLGYPAPGTPRSQKGPRWACDDEVTLWAEIVPPAVCRPIFSWVGPKQGLQPQPFQSPESLPRRHAGFWSFLLGGAHLFRPSYVINRAWASPTFMLFLKRRRSFIEGLNYIHFCGLPLG